MCFKNFQFMSNTSMFLVDVSSTAFYLTGRPPVNQRKFVSASVDQVFFNFSTFWPNFCDSSKQVISDFKTKLKDPDVSYSCYCSLKIYRGQPQMLETYKYIPIQLLDCNSSCYVLARLQLCLRTAIQIHQTPQVTTVCLSKT